MKRAIILVCTLLLALYVSATTLSLAADKPKLRQELITQLTTKDLPLSSVHNAVASLLKIDNKIDISEEQKQKLCGIVSKFDTAQATPKSLYEYVVTSIALKCQNALSSIEEATTKAVKQEKLSFADFYYLVRTIYLSRKQFSSLNKDKELLKGLFTRVGSKFNEDTGAFSPDENLQKIGYSYEILSVLQNLMLDIDSNTSDQFLTTLVKVGKHADKFLTKISSASIKDASIFTRGLNKLASIVPLKKITRENIEQLADDILAKKPKSDNLEEIYDFSEAVGALAQSSLFVPVYVSQVSINENTVSLTVSDVLGGKIADKVTLNAVTTSSGKVFGTSNMQPQGEASFVTTVDGSKVKGPGAYKFEFSINPEKVKSTLQPFTIVRTFFSESSLELKEVTIAVISKETDRETSAVIAQFPGKISKAIVIDNISAQKLGVYFDLHAAPQQTFIRFSNEKKDAVFAIKKQDDSHFRIDFNFEKVGNTFGYVSGEYELSLLVGDVSMKKSIQWVLGTVELTFPARPVNDDDLLFAVREGIEHKFTPPAKRAPAELATMVTGVVLGLPLFVLFIGLIRLQPSLTNCPGGLDFIFALVFHGLILAMLGVIALFFFEITIFDTFKYLAVLGVAATIVGTKALRGYAALREAESKSQ